MSEKYINAYTNGFEFAFTEHISSRVFDVEIEVDVFEYSDKYNFREKAHVVLKKENLSYECDLYDKHNYESDFHPVTLNSKRMICFRKTLYGFTFVNADTLAEEYEYYPKTVDDGGESFIITDIKQLDDILIFEGCYWACPYECFAYDYGSKRFYDLSMENGIVSLDKTLLQGEKIVILGTDKNDYPKEVAVSKQDIYFGINKHGKTEF